jgi:hypothetical protein
MLPCSIVYSANQRDGNIRQRAACVVIIIATFRHDVQQLRASNRCAATLARGATY